MITLVDGLLSVDMPKQEAIIIEEQPMVVYEKFFLLYTLAVQIMALNPESYFTHLYVDNAQFRKAVIDALKAIGFANPENLTPRVMQELLISRRVDGKPAPGYLFALHNEAPPDPKATAAKMSRNPTKSSLLSTLRVWWQSTSLKIQPFWNSGLCVAF
jgi:hypothetical protein